MVDPQRLQLAALQPAQHPPVGGLEDAGALHPQAGKRVDVEEAPVIDVVAGHPPVGQPPRLPRHQLVQRIVAGGVAGAAIEVLHALPDPARQPAVVVGEAGQLEFVPGGIALAALAQWRIGAIARRQVGERVDQRADHCVRIALAIVGGRRPGRSTEDLRRVPWVDREPVGVVVQAEIAGPGVELQLQLARIEHLAVVVAQHRQQHAAFHAGRGRMPFDVEGLGVQRRRAVFQHVQPPRVVGLQHAHVVGHHVQHLAHAVPAQRQAHAFVPVLAADFGIEFAVVDDVVAVRAARPRLEVGRAVQVADAERGQIWDGSGDVVEPATGVELHAVR